MTKIAVLLLIHASGRFSLFQMYLGKKLKSSIELFMLNLEIKIHY